MHAKTRAAIIVAAGLLLLQAASATVVGRLSFEELVDTSDLIVSGRITRAWAAWDADHKYIWTHYEMSVKSALKGTPGSTVEIAEPGGALEDKVLSIAGTVVYTTGENVLVFLQRMPNGYLRTTGWGQGRFLVGDNGRIHADSTLRGLEIIDTRTPLPASMPLTTLDGMGLNEFSLRIAARARVASGTGSTR
jgi:hypothetical protein